LKPWEEFIKGSAWWMRRYWEIVLGVLYVLMRGVWLVVICSEENENLRRGGDMR